MTQTQSPASFQGIRLDRRSALSMGAGLTGLLALGTFGALSGCSGKTGEHRDHNLLVLILLGMVIPETATPGSGNQANAEFIQRAVDAGLKGIPTDTLDRLDDELASRSGKPFHMADPEERESILAALDREVFAGDEVTPSPWVPVKALILMAYYTSEAGASQELRYELAPGRYDPDVTVDAEWRPLSNDWSGNAVRKDISGT